jgi:hypothetical protein
MGVAARSLGPNHRRLEQPGPSEHRENDSREKRHRSSDRQGGARGLEELAIWNATRAGRFARPAAEAAVDVLVHIGIVGSYGALEQRPHQKNSAARTVVLVVVHQIGRACLQAESAVHARVDSRENVGERRSRQRAAGDRAFGQRIGRKRGVRHQPSIPGLRSVYGSNECRTLFDSGSEITLGEIAAHWSAGRISYAIRSPCLGVGIARS